METIVCQDRLGTSIREPEALSWRLLLLFLSGVAVADRVHGAGRAGAGQAQGHAADHSDARLRELGKSVMTAQNISPRVLHAQHDAAGDLSILPSQAQASNTHTHTHKKKLRRYISRNITRNTTWVDRSSSTSPPIRVMFSTPSLSTKGQRIRGFHPVGVRMTRPSLRCVWQIMLERL